LHNCDETALYYRLLPDKLLDLKKASNKVDMKTNEEKERLLLRANKTDNPKLKPLSICTNQSPLVFHALQHKVSACSLQRKFQHLDDMQYFCFMVWKWVCIISKTLFAFQETRREAPATVISLSNPSFCCSLKSKDGKQDKSCVSATEYDCTDSSHRSRCYLILQSLLLWWATFLCCKHRITSYRVSENISTERCCVQCLFSL
jgi:hypothetical protein